jgi:2-iminobutanoate/2-iminopropanoate deaminase
MRRVVRLPGVVDVGELTEIDGHVLSSTITAADAASGTFEREPTSQVESAFRNLQGLLRAGGLSPNEIGLVRIAIGEPVLRSALAASWDGLFPPRNRPARRIDVYPLREGELIQLQVLGVRGATRRAFDGPAAGANPETAAVRLGDLVFSSSISGIEPGTGELVANPQAQVRQAFANMQALLREAGGSLDDVAHLLISVRDLADNEDVLAAFLEAFPRDGDRTARKNVYDDQLKGTSTVAQLQFIGVLGQGRRQNYEVDGAPKRHPNPLGNRIGKLLFSAGIGGHDPAGNEVERQVARALSNVKALMDQAGGSLADIAQVTFMVDDYAHTPLIEAGWRKLFPDPNDEPARHVMAFGGRGSNYQIQVHILAVMPDRRA